MASSSQPPRPPDLAPIRIRSQPSDLELAEMLRPLVDPRASPPSNLITIHHADVYARDPADLTQQFPATVADDGQEAWYFSTELLPKSRKRKRRCTDSGVWHGEGRSKSKPVVGSEARRYLFSFINKVDGKKGDRAGWIMHEFRLPVPDGNEESPVVVCKVVFRSSRRCPPNPNESAAAEVLQAKAVEARDAAVKAREALGRRDVADLHEWHSYGAAREAVWEAENEAWEAGFLRWRRMWGEMEQQWRRSLELGEAGREVLARRVPELREALGRGLEQQLKRSLELWEVELREAESEVLARREAELREAALAREPELREAESDGLARREAARLAELERSLLERERHLAAREAAFDSRLQELQAELMAEVEALLLIMMAAAALVARDGRPAAAVALQTVAHCGGALEPLV